MRIERGQVLAKPGSITPHTKFEAEVYACRKMKVVVTLRFSAVTVLSFISARPT